MSSNRSFRLAALPALALFLLLPFFTPLTCADTPPALSVLSAKPIGPVEAGAAVEVTIVFSAPVVSLGAPDPGAKPPEWLRMKPAGEFYWRWAGTDTLVGFPKTKLPPATRFSFTVAKGVKSVDGRLLPADFSFAFDIPGPQAAVIVDAIPSYYDSPLEFVRQNNLFDSKRVWEQNQLGETDSLLLVFDMPIDPAGLSAALKVEVHPEPMTQARQVLPPEQIARLQKEDPAAFAAWNQFLQLARGPEKKNWEVGIEPLEKFPQQVFRIKAKNPWPLAAAVAAKLIGAVKPLKGAEKSFQAVSFTFHVPPPPAPLMFDEAETPESPVNPGQVVLKCAAPFRILDLLTRLRWRSVGAERWEKLPLTPEDQENMKDWSNDGCDLQHLSLQPGTAYEVCLDPGLSGTKGGRIDFPWCRRLLIGHSDPQIHLTEGSGVVEWTGPHQLPLSTVNITQYRILHRLVQEEELVRLLTDFSDESWRWPDQEAESEASKETPADRWKKRQQGLAERFHSAPEVVIERPLDRWAITPVELDPALNGKPGVLRTEIWAHAKAPLCTDQGAIDRRDDRQRIVLTQVTDLGLTVKHSQTEGLMIWVTRLGDTQPLEGVAIRVRDKENHVLWEGRTDSRGLAQAPGEEIGKKVFLVTARRGDDLAYARTNWYQGHRGWEFNLPTEWRNTRLWTGTAWPDRGIVRPGEKVHIKAMLRRQEDRRLALPTGWVTFLVRDAMYEPREVRRLPLGPDGGAEIEYQVPETAALGGWNVEIGGEWDSEKKHFKAGESYSVEPASFLVAQYRRPKFRVLVTADKDEAIAGDRLRIEAEGQLLAGGPMGGAPVTWSSFAERRYWWHPGAEFAGFEFMPNTEGENESSTPNPDLPEKEGKLDGLGKRVLSIEKIAGDPSWPMQVTFEAEVTDVDRQTSAARQEVMVFPGEYMLGLKAPGYFVEGAKGVETALIAVQPDRAVRDKAVVRIELYRRTWDSVRRRNPAGLFEFESKAVDTKVAEQELVSGPKPVPVRFGAIPAGQYFLLAKSQDPRGNQLQSRVFFYALGEGGSAWRMDQANRIDLVVEKKSYVPGETARVLVKAPWAKSRALITIERGGVLESRVEELSGTMPVLEIPVRSEYAPNVFVSVVLLRGRIEAAGDKQLIDPGRPAYRIGMAEILVPPLERQLTLRLAPGAPEFRPGQEATVRLKVSGADGRPRRTAVTLWAVDSGVLGLTGYSPPNLIEIFYPRRGLGVATSESRTRLVGRRSYGNKGGRHGGGGGFGAGAEQLRSDFRPLAFWQGDLFTDDQGEALVTFKLPESLTTYRLMAVGSAGEEEFGSAAVEFRVSKPLGLEPALPRFLRPGDKTEAGVVVRNRTAVPRTVEVRAQVATPGVIALTGEAVRTVTVPAQSSSEVRFSFTGQALGTAKLRFFAASPSPTPEQDGLELPLPVLAALPTETVAVFFPVEQKAEQSIAVPAGVLESAGGLTVALGPGGLLEAQTAVDYLLAYPHRCAEQIGSRLLGILGAQKVGGGLAPAQVDGLPRDRWLAQTVARLESFQGPGGGFSFWRGGEESEPLTIHIALVLAEAKAAGVPVDGEMIEKTWNYLERLVNRSEPWTWGERDGWTSKVGAVLACGRLGQPLAPAFDGLFGARVGRPTWPKAQLALAMLEANPKDPRARTLLQELRNNIATGVRAARLKEPQASWNWLFLHSEARGSAWALEALLAANPKDPTAPKLVAGLIDHLVNLKDFATQDGAVMLKALGRYSQAIGGAAGSRRAVALLGGNRVLEAVFVGLGGGERTADVSMKELAAKAGEVPERKVPLVVTKEGEGPLQAAATLRFVRSQPGPAIVHGIVLARRLVDAAGKEVQAVRAGDQLQLELQLDLPTSLRYAAVEIPLPAGLEAVDPNLATTAKRRVAPEDRAGRSSEEGEGEAELYAWDWNCFCSPGFDHVELRDDRIQLYATYLPAGTQKTRFPVRATSSGTFFLGPAKAEAMYDPGTYGTTAGGTVEIR